MRKSSAMVLEEWARVRALTAVFAALGVAWALACRLIAVASGADTWDLVNIVTLAWFVLPSAAIVLGSTTTSGDDRLPVPDTHWISRAVRAFAVLGVRMLALGIVSAATLLTAAIALGSQRTSTFAVLLPERYDGWVDVGGAIIILGAWLCCCLALAVIASAFAHRPTSAALHTAACVTALSMVVPSVRDWLLGWRSDDLRLIGILVTILAGFLLVLAAWATARRIRQVRLGARAMLALTATALAPVTLVALYAHIEPVVSRHRAVSVRREFEATCPQLAWYYHAPTRPLPKDNWVTLALGEAAMPLVLDEGRRERFGERGRPAIPPAEGVDDLKLWLELELASPTTTVKQPPQAVVRLLDGREEALEEIRTILLAGDAVRWPANRYPNEQYVHSLLLGHALAKVHGGEPEAARRNVLAAWRLARSSLHNPRSNPRLRTKLAGDTAVALRKIPDLPTAWADRLDVSEFRDAWANIYVRTAADRLRTAEDMSAFRVMMDENDERLENWYWNPILSSWGTDSAREMITFAQAIRNPSRCGLSLHRPDLGNPKDPHTLERSIDMLAVQFELTRKVVQLQQLRAASPTGAWPESVPGIESSACTEIWWRYSGGASVSLIAEGSTATWLQSDDCGPALSYTSP